MFLVNDIIRNTAEFGLNDERIIFISSNNQNCYTVELNISKIIIRERKLADLEFLYSEGTIELVNENLGIFNLLENKLSKKTIDNRDKAYEIIKYIYEKYKEPYIFDCHFRRKAILDASVKFSVSDVVVYKYLRLFLQGGKVKNSLIPKYYLCGSKGKEKSYNVKTGRLSYNEMLTGIRSGVIVDKEIKACFEYSLKYFNNSREATLTKVYEKMIQRFFSEKNSGKVYDKSEIPTFRQFEYWFNNNRDLDSEIKNRKGAKNFALNYRPLLSNSTYETFGPGHRYQIDATIADVYLVSRIDRHSIVGRPTVYLIVDVFSRLITGIFVGLEHPSWNGAASAIYNCSEDKVEFCKKYDIHITNDQWPSIGLPQIILGDRGEMVGPICEKVVEELNIAIENTPSYRGDAKGIVEQKFNSINQNIKYWTPGAIKKDYRERGVRDYRLDAVLDIVDFTKIIIHSVIEKNNNPIEDYPLTQDMIDDHVNPIPTEIWSWGMKNRTGNLRRVPDDLLKMSLMRRGRAAITSKGIVFKNVTYFTNLTEEYSWYLEARALGRDSIEIVYDNRDMSIIHIVYDNKLIPCTIKVENELFANKTFEEIEDYNFLKVVNLENLENIKNQNTLNVNVATDNIIKEAIKKGEKNGARKKRIDGINKNRKNENEDLRKEQSLSRRYDSDFDNTIDESEDNKDNYNSNVRHLEFIRSKRKKRKL